MDHKPILTIDEVRLLLDTICQVIKHKLKITRDSCKNVIASHDEIIRLCFINEINFSDLYNEAVD